MNSGRFAIVSRTQRIYVARPGYRRSFTPLAKYAQRFESRQAAEANCCGDEHVVKLSERERYTLKLKNPCLRYPLRL